MIAAVLALLLACGAVDGIHSDGYEAMTTTAWQSATSPAGATTAGDGSYQTITLAPGASTSIVYSLRNVYPVAGFTFPSTAVMLGVEIRGRFVGSSDGLRVFASIERSFVHTNFPLPGLNAYYYFLSAEHDGPGVPSGNPAVPSSFQQISFGGPNDLFIPPVDDYQTDDIAQKYQPPLAIYPRYDPLETNNYFDSHAKVHIRVLNTAPVNASLYVDHIEWRIHYANDTGFALIAASSTIGATLNSRRALTATIAGNGTVGVTTNARRSIAAAIAARGRVVLVALKRGTIIHLFPEIESTSTIDVTLKRKGALDATIAGRFVLGVTLSARRALGALAIVGRATITATAVGRRLLSAAVNATSTIAAAVTGRRSIAAAVAPTSTIAATVNKVGSGPPNTIAPTMTMGCTLSARRVLDSTPGVAAAATIDCGLIRVRPLSAGIAGTFTINLVELSRASNNLAPDGRVIPVQAIDNVIPVNPVDNVIPTA